MPMSATDLPSTTLKKWLNLIWFVMDEGKVTRRITLLWMLWITTEVFRWALMFAERPGGTSVDTAAILAAILTPLAGLHAAIFSFYRSLPTTMVVTEKESYDGNPSK